jgi:hypothetical protein
MKKTEQILFKCAATVTSAWLTKQSTPPSVDEAMNAFESCLEQMRSIAQMTQPTRGGLPTVSEH